MSEVIKILIADDHQMVIDGLKSLLRREEDIQIIGEALNGIQALELIKENVPDILITDINMPEMDGLELTKRVKLEYPEVKVLVLSMHNDKEIIAEVLLAEAEGYILKNTGKQELMDAIKSLTGDSTHYSKEVVNVMLQKIKTKSKQDAELTALSPRELEIVQLISREYSTQQIAEELNISPRTVDTHRKNIMFKTNSKTLVGLIKFAFYNGIIKHPY